MPEIPRQEYSFAGLDMDRFVELIRESFFSWIIADHLGSLYRCAPNQSLSIIPNMRGMSNDWIYQTQANEYWDRFKLFLNENCFVVASVAHANFFYCHRRVLTVFRRHILFMGPVSFWNARCFLDCSVDMESASFGEISRMRHVLLQGCGFNIRIQPNTHKIFVRQDDFLNGNIKLSWIKDLPNTEWDILNASGRRIYTVRDDLIQEDDEDGDPEEENRNRPINNNDNSYNITTFGDNFF